MSQSGRQNGKRNPAVFGAYWTDPADGRRLRRATRLELREAHRIYRRYRRLRERAAA